MDICLNSRLNGRHTSLRKRSSFDGARGFPCRLRVRRLGPWENLGGSFVQDAGTALTTENGTVEL
jgi:hypothetical protein